MSYRPGTHLIATLLVPDNDLLHEGDAFRNFIQTAVDAQGLTRLGEVFHDFPGGGFTGVVCLCESHLSVHTWPEYGRLNMDVYLSNHEQSNEGIADALFESICAWFGGTVAERQNLTR
ncbi:MAG: S-adenosylmethionine decarboxylase [Chitinophagaceae bacterium]|nr:MAG: S-adenosylmethionine decarboxylase [Chitinophagaceae bacterium]